MVMLNGERKNFISCENEDRGDEQRPKRCSNPEMQNSNVHEENDEERNHQSYTTGQSRNFNGDDTTEVLFNTLLNASKKLWQQIKSVYLFAMEDLGGYQLFDRIAQWCVQHPQMAICVLAACFVAFLPLFLFATFALSTIFMTFTGFLVLEGTLLTILTMILCGLLGALAVFLFFLVLIGVATYLGVSRVYDMYGCTELQRTTLRSFMQRDDRNTNRPRRQNVN